MAEDLEQALRKLSSILGWRQALHAIEDSLRQGPQTSVPRVLHAITIGELKPRTAERLMELLTKLARENPAVRAALDKAALQPYPEAGPAQEALERAGQPINQLKQHLARANTLA